VERQCLFPVPVHRFLTDFMDVRVQFRVGQLLAEL